MTPERWRQVKDVVRAALECAPGERAALLDRACGPDAELRREVESLLAAADGATGFLEAPAARDVAGLVGGREVGGVGGASPGAPRPAGAGETFARLAAALGGRYDLQRELGAGGMATVYLARDLRHRRPVAIKVMDPELGAILGAGRFLREIETAANLTHPHILPLHDSGAADGLLYYVMPYIAGETLRDRLRRGGRLPAPEALRVVGEVADALDYAHRHGVVHRDVKPENVLLDETGHALVADFGIARAIHRATKGSRADDAPSATLTAAGLVVGTPAYMSPEQAAGEHELDGRSDQYSLACVAYELLAGEPPFTGAGVVAKRLTQPPPSLVDRDPTAPPAADAALRRALALAPEERFPTVGEFAGSLARAAVPIAGNGRASAAPDGAPTPRARHAPGGAPRRRLAAALAGLLVVVTIVLAAQQWRNARDDGPAGRSELGGTVGLSPMDGTTRVAVLPFENLGRPEDAYFADGMTDEVRGKLAALRTLEVIARASSNEYRGTRKPLEEVARELGVEYLLTATVRWVPGASGAPGRVRVSPELVRVVSGRAPVTTWQQGFDAVLADVFQVQAEIATRVAQGLDVEFGAGERARLGEPPTASLAAYDAYLQGEAASDGLVSLGTEPLPRATRFYERAVALDSTFAQAWSRLAVARAHLVFNSPAAGGSPAAVRRAADRAVALAPDHAGARLALGSYYLMVENDPARAADQFTLGLRAAPNDAELLTVAAWADQALGRWDAAVAHLRRAVALDPRSVNSSRWLGFTLMWLRRYPEARDALERGLALAPADPTTLQARAMVELAQGDLAGARAVLRRAPAELDPATLAAFMARLWDLGWVLDDADQRLLLGLGPESFGGDRLSWALGLAQVHAARGDDGSARIYADSARAAAEAALAASPQDVQLPALLGVALAYLGRRDEAVRAGRRSVALLPVERDAYAGAYLQHQLARIHILAGEPDAALDQLEPLLQRPYYLSPGWLRIDPAFRPLLGHPRFERLVGSGR